ncbi:MAG: CotH kinase family protein, partial [Synergistaceae bacterium]|nr:CotH kinase family protein [Synergistaceae bacterium]
EQADILEHESAERHAADTELSERITSRTAAIESELQEAITEEGRQRENSDAQIIGQTEVIYRGQEELSEALIHTAISSHEGIKTQKESLQSEKAERESADELIHSELDEHAQRLEVLEDDNADIHAEQSVLERLRHESDETTYRAINEVSEGLLTESLSRVNSENRLRSRIESESAERESEDTRLHEELEATSSHSTERDIELLRGLDELSAGVLQNTAALHHEADRRRKLEDVVAKIKSPVDWSKSTSLQIPEPRCAVVNISGINSMPTSKTAELNAVMEFWDMQGNFFRKNIVCSAQGNSSMSYPKKNVKFDLLNEDDSEFEMKIGNWPVQDGFHLKAFYTDFFRGVGAVSYKFCDEIMRFNGILSDRPYKKVLLDVSSIKTSGTSLNNPDDLTLQTDTGALCHPDSFPCIVYLNGEFYGVFSWQIKKHRANYHLEKSKVEHIHLDGTLYRENFWDGTIKWTAFEIRNPNKLYTMNGKKYDGDAPKELIDETSANYNPENKDHVRSAQVKKYIQDFVARFGELKSLYASYGVSDIVRAKYEELFDWENQRDYMIFSDVVKNSDGFGKNWQWFTYDGVKWYVGAYDLDMSFGGHWQG